MIYKKNILIEKQEEISIIFEKIDCKKKFILNKDCICSIYFQSELFKQSVNYIMLFKKSDLSKKKISKLIKSYQSKKQYKIGDGVIAIIENVVIGPTDDGLVSESYIAIPIGIWMDTKCFVGLVLNETIKKFLNIVYSDLKQKIIKSDFDD